jgi:hypothetical protein
MASPLRQTMLRPLKQICIRNSGVVRLLLIDRVSAQRWTFTGDSVRLTAVLRFAILIDP